MTKTNALESLVIASFVRGLSVRDVEAALAEALRQRCLRRDPPCQGHWPAARRDQLPHLVWAVLDRASRGWRGLTMIAEGLRLLQNLRRSLLDPPRQLWPRTVTETRNADRPENVNSLCPYRVSWPNLKTLGHIRERVARDSRARAVSAPRPPESATSAVASRPPLP